VNAQQQSKMDELARTNEEDDVKVLVELERPHPPGCTGKPAGESKEKTALRGSSVSTPARLAP